jgi:5-methylcytosine-specific restriction endonuclease McrA
MSNSTTKKIINPQTGRRDILDLTGRRFGKLVAIEFVGLNAKQHVALWRCECDCGRTSVPRSNGLTSGNSRSCGSCIPPGPRTADLSGQRFGKLTVVSLDAPGCRGGIRWLCECDCGSSSVVYGHNLKNGQTTSCGCNARGENHYNWNPDRDAVDSRNRVSVELNDWRSAVYERDDYACRACGSASSGNLNAHHLDSWTAYPERRLEQDNGITLCVECHKEFHAWMGGTFTPCTEQDFANWLCDPALE